MTISKAHWAGIGTKLKEWLSAVEFTLNGQSIKMYKHFIAENKTGILVFIDGVQNQGWGMPDHESFNPLVKQIWRKKTYRPGASFARKMSKQKGGKAWLKRKENAYLFEVKEYYLPYFDTAAAVVRQYKKIEGLELVDSDKYLPAPEAENDLNV
ncbi:hypothetical protein [Rahnella contaminans]|uniref:hypothetical protein n=1 Tax=Rahnella contaminans TaxID=2703882 RepID=UPI003C2D2853